MQKTFLRLSFCVKLFFTGLLYWSGHTLEAADPHEDLFEHEKFIVQSSLQKTISAQTFTYTLELIEVGPTPQVTLELGNKPFENIVVTHELMTNETLVRILAPPDASEIATNASPHYKKFPPLQKIPTPLQTAPSPIAKIYTITTYTLEGTPLQQETQLTIEPWEVFALLDDEIFSISLKAKTLQWDATTPIVENTLLSSLSAHPYYSRFLAISLGIFLLSVILGIIWFILAHKKRLKKYRYFKEMIWKTIKIRYNEQKIEDLYYQIDKSHYFKAVENCVQQTLHNTQDSHNLPKPLSQELMHTIKKLGEIAGKIAENNKNYSHLTETSFSWVKQTFFLTLST